MKIISCSDLHGDYSLYQRIVDLSYNLKVDLVTISGDLFGFPEGYNTLESAQMADAHIHGHILESFGNDGIHFNCAASGKKRAMFINIESLNFEVLD